ncbi:MAG: rhodanese-like domain-containing protein [Minwuia sp.]|uniref:rhodanese-like domain-containing protein n=1 Tax=Minwuia sp. TaxID=2493630 RepID=UPI003A85EAB0
MYEHAIPVDALVQEVGRPDGPLLTDVRIDPDFDDDPRILPAAIRMPHTEIERRSRDFEGRRVVVYCQKGLKLSMGAAAILRDCGIQAAFLTGGQFAWRDAGAPLLTAARLPTRTAGGGPAGSRRPAQRPTSLR